VATPKWLQDVMKQSSTAAGIAKSRANAPTKQEMKQANEMAKTWLTNIGLTMIPVGLIGTKLGQALAKGYGKAISSGITNTLKRGGSSPRTKINWRLPRNTSDTRKESPAFIVKMKPEEYLKLIHKDYQRDQYKNVLKAMKKGNKFDIPHLRIDQIGKGFEVIGQEGRHRAIASKSLGSESIPVHIMLPNKKKYWDMIGYKGGGTEKTGKNYLQKNITIYPDSDIKLSKAQKFKNRFKK